MRKRGRPPKPAPTLPPELTDFPVRTPAQLADWKKWADSAAEVDALLPEVAPAKRRRGNPNFKTATDDPLGMALLVHERRAKGLSYKDARDSVADFFGTDDSTVLRTYKKFLPSCIAYFEANGLAQPAPLEPPIAPRSKRNLAR